MIVCHCSVAQRVIQKWLPKNQKEIWEQRRIPQLSERLRKSLREKSEKEEYFGNQEICFFVGAGFEKTCQII